MLENGRTETVFSLEDLIWLIRQHMGSDTARLLEEYTRPDDRQEYIEDLESEIRELKHHYREVMQELRMQSETIAGLIGGKDIDRKKLSAAAGRIGHITWREQNV